MAERLTDVTELFEQAVVEFSKKSFAERVRVCKTMSEINKRHSFIKYNGYVEFKSNFAVKLEEGDYYVYLWKHLDGGIFYVGSGHDERYRSKNRNAECLKEMDKGDSVIYMVLTGTDSKTARFYERYISYNLGLAGYTLTNSDNNLEKVGEGHIKKWMTDNAAKIDTDLTRSIEKSIIDDIIWDTDFRADHFYSIQAFRNECGNEWFSSTIDWRR
jgi:hypothetical protein